jgi:hypothetical protein
MRDIVEKLCRIEAELNRRRQPDALSAYNAGEKKHLTFADTVFGPEFEPLAEAIVREGVCPRIICESAGTMAEDALYMKNAWLNAREGIV